MWATAAGSGNFLAEQKPVTGLVVTSYNKEKMKDATRYAAKRAKKTEREFHNKRLALKREQNYENKTDHTVHFLEGQVKLARREMVKARKELANKQKAVKKHNDEQK